MLNNKNAQMGEAMTWIVATLIIILLLSIAFYATGLLAKFKANPSSKLSHEYPDSDLLMQESLFAYFQIQDSFSRQNILANLNRMNENNEFNEDFDSNFEKLNLILEETP